MYNYVCTEKYQRTPDVQSEMMLRQTWPPSQCYPLLALAMHHSPCKIGTCISERQQPGPTLLPCILHGRGMSGPGQELKALLILDVYPLNERNNIE